MDTISAKLKVLLANVRKLPPAEGMESKGKCASDMIELTNHMDFTVTKFQKLVNNTKTCLQSARTAFAEMDESVAAEIGGG